MKVRHVMTRGVITVPPEMSVRKAAKLMLQYELSGFPVVEPGKGLVGIITEGDLLHRVETGTECRPATRFDLFVSSGQYAAEYARAHGRTVGEVMTRNVISVGEDASLEDAVRLMETHRVKRLPVVRDGGVVGMISRGTLLHAFVAATPEQPPEKVSDDDIRKRLDAELSQLCWLDRGSVWADVEHGIVRLSGVIGDERERLALRVLAENVPGVTQVQDHLVNIERSDRP